jgi:hypothetical protein
MLKIASMRHWSDLVCMEAMISAERAIPKAQTRQ